MHSSGSNLTSVTVLGSSERAHYTQSKLAVLFKPCISETLLETTLITLHGSRNIPILLVCFTSPINKEMSNERWNVGRHQKTTHKHLTLPSTVASLLIGTRFPRRFYFNTLERRIPTSVCSFPDFDSYIPRQPRRPPHPAYGMRNTPWQQVARVRDRVVIRKGVGLSPVVQVALGGHHRAGEASARHLRGLGRGEERGGAKGEGRNETNSGHARAD